MKILLVNYEYPPLGGGGGEFTKALKNGLEERGHKVKLLVPKNRENKNSSSFLSLIGFPFLSLPRLVKILRKHDFDVINGHFSIPSSFCLPIFSKLTNTPLVVNIMGADIYDPTRYTKVRPLLNFVNFNYVLKFADKIISPSNDLKNRLKDENIKQKTEIIPYFLDEEFEYTFNRESFTGGIDILTVCRLIKRKNLKTALKTIKLLIEKEYNVNYRIAGDGPLKSELKRFVKTNNLNPYVDFLGYVDEKTKKELYSKSDVFFLPSYHEAFGIVFLEALAFGLPIVTSNRGGQVDLIKNGVGETAEPNSYIEFANKIIKTYKKRKKIREKTEKVIERKFSKTKILKNYEEVYSDVSKK